MKDGRPVVDAVVSLTGFSLVGGPAYNDAAAAEEMLAWLTGRIPQTTRGVIDLFRLNWAFDSSKAAGSLGYSPRPLQEGMARTVEWIRSEGLVP